MDRAKADTSKGIVLNRIRIPRKNTGFRRSIASSREALQKDERTSIAAACTVLAVRVLESLQVCLQTLRVFALSLQFGLQLLHQSFKTQDLDLQSTQVVGVGGLG